MKARLDSLKNADIERDLVEQITFTNDIKASEVLVGISKISEGNLKGSKRLLSFLDQILNAGGFVNALRREILLGAMSTALISESKDRIRAHFGYSMSAQAIDITIDQTTGVTKLGRIMSRSDHNHLIVLAILDSVMDADLDMDKLMKDYEELLHAQPSLSSAYESGDWHFRKAREKNPDVTKEEQARHRKEALDIALPRELARARETFEVIWEREKKKALGFLVHFEKTLSDSIHAYVTAASRFTDAAYSLKGMVAKFTDISKTKSSLNHSQNNWAERYAY